jgi:hypothetical protein
MDEINKVGVNANATSKVDTKLRWLSTTHQVVAFDITPQGTSAQVNGSAADLPLAVQTIKLSNKLYQLARTHQIETVQLGATWKVHFLGPEYQLERARALAAAPHAQGIIMAASACAADATGAGACAAQANAGTACGGAACGAQAGTTGACGAQACAADACIALGCPANACGANACIADLGLLPCPLEACAAHLGIPECPFIL